MYSQQMHTFNKREMIDLGFKMVWNIVAFKIIDYCYCLNPGSQSMR